MSCLPCGQEGISVFSRTRRSAKRLCVERTKVVDSARQLIAANDAQEQVQIIHGDMITVELPEQVDLIVSEWMGGNGVDEGFLPAVLVARDRWLKPQGKMLPERVIAWIAPVWDGELESDLNFWRSLPFEVDLSLIAEATISEVTLLSASHHRKHAFSRTSTDVGDRRLYLPVGRGSLALKASLLFSVARESNFNALATWFHAISDRHRLTNAPTAPQTHWGRLVYPLNRAIKVSKETDVLVEFVCEPTIDSHCEVNGQPKSETARGNIIKVSLTAQPTKSFERSANSVAFMRKTCVVMRLNARQVKRSVRRLSGRNLWDI